MTAIDAAAGAAPASLEPTTTRTWRESRWLTPLAIVVALVPLVASAISMAVRVGTSYRPQADQAWIEMQIRDIGHLPVLLGPYSRFGWFHPGPLLYYVLWLPYRLTGSTSVSVVIAALVVNGAAIAGVALIAKRRGGLTLLLLTLLLLGLLERSLGAQFLRDAWNPSITVLPLALLVFLAWTASAGDVWAVPVAAGVASFLVQTHVSYGLIVGTLALGAVVGLAVTERRRRPVTPARRRTYVWGAVLTAGVLTVLWLPVLVQQLFREPGNVGELYHFFRNHDREHAYGDALRVIGQQLTIAPEWLRGSDAVNRFSGAVDLSGSMPIPLVFVGLLAATVVSWWRDKVAWRLNALVLVAWLAGFAAVTRIVGEIFPYLVRWSWALGMLTWLAISWTVVVVWRHRRDADRHAVVGRVALALVVAGFAVVTVVNTVDAAGAGDPAPYASQVNRRLLPALLREVPEGPGVVEIRTSGGDGSTWVGGGLANELERRGIETRVVPKLGFAYGPDRVLDGEQVKLEVLPVESAELERKGAPEGFTEIAQSGRVHLFVREP
ncbi:MAG: hypothetical protein U0W40_14875 [Acidimicrobiia bacterium]